MNNLKLICFFSLVLLLSIQSCSTPAGYEGEIIFTREAFKVDQTLMGKTVAFKDLIMKPSQIQVYDSLLMTYNQEAEKLFHLFNLKTGEKIGERITMGQGPKEMILPFFVNQKDSIKLFDMMTSTVYTYTIQEFVNNPDPTPAQSITLTEKPLWSELNRLNGKYISVSNKPESPCFLFNEKGDKIADFGSYPESEVTYTDLELVDAFRAILVTNRKDKVAVCHFFTDLIDIYNEEGKLEKHLHGPDHFQTLFQEFKDGDRIGSEAVPGTYKDAFYSPVSVDNSFFVLYNGKMVEDPAYNLLAKEIFVIGWDGSLQCHYRLDQGVSRIAVDAAHRKIYGISDDPEYHIVEFEF